MILVHIIPCHKKQTEEIANLLLEERLLTHAMISEQEVFQKEGASRKIISKKQGLIIGQTKALLFNQINELLSARFPNEMPILFSVPIIYMDNTQAQSLRLNTKKV